MTRRSREASLYKRILLAFDGSVEGRRALREGALLARRCEAQVYLLSVVPDTFGRRVAKGVDAALVAYEDTIARSVLEEGVSRLRRLGFSPAAHLAAGEPAQEIAAFARQINADLIVVGHRRQSALARWWSGASGAYLSDIVDCSLLIVRDGVSDEAFEAELAHGSAAAGVQISRS